MTKRIFALLVAVIVCFSMSIFAFAAEDSDRQLPIVYDVNDLDDFNVKSEKALIKNLESYTKENDVEIAIFIASSLYIDSSLKSFTDKIYDDYGYGYGKEKDGVLIVVCPDYFDTSNDSLYIKANGSVKEAFTDKEIEKIASKYGSDIKNGEFEGTVEFCKTCIDDYLHPSVAWYWIPGSLLIGFVIAFLIMKAKTADLKSVKSQVNADSYVVPNSLILAQSYDNFLYKNVSKTPRQTSSSSSSGQSRGGGGGARL